ncbi:hypothetical protein EUGRSUZ_H04062 [Eucalyptus grandis]|uniref:Uncharacterized protein n=2 Tax=Eucalyptus grandis TaxID=71139 RepID=A0ACC3JWI4_EUCGR|nr:hypothetical protein EUGRSUZ_H04062 [Eucalyptus grandis]
MRRPDFSRLQFAHATPYFSLFQILHILYGLSHLLSVSSLFSHIRISRYSKYPLGQKFSYPEFYPTYQTQSYGEEMTNDDIFSSSNMKSPSASSTSEKLDKENTTERYVQHTS